MRIEACYILDPKFVEAEVESMRAKGEGQRPAEAISVWRAKRDAGLKVFVICLRCNFFA